MPTLRAARRTLVLGSCGGVGRALLALLDRHPKGKSLLHERETLLLLDREKGPDIVPRTVRVERLTPAMIRDASHFAEVLLRHRVDEVIELAGVGTLSCVQAAADAGANYLCTGLEHWPGSRPVSSPTGSGILAVAQNLLPGRRPVVSAGSHLIGSGMNPGVVNALVPVAMEALAQRVDRRPTAEDLDLHAILFTEEDTTRSQVPRTDTPRIFPMTWHPFHCLEEILESRASFVDQGTIVELDHAPPRVPYRARCGRDVIDAMIVAHDEVVTIGHRYPSLEVAYLYRIPNSARAALARHPSGRPNDFIPLRLYPPHCTDALVGYDRVGVLLCSRSYGEFWIGFENSVEDARPYETNATALQVAAGVLAGWSLLGTVRGIHTTDDLDPHRVVDGARAVLGNLHIVHDPHAPVTSLRDRQVGRSWREADVADRPSSIRLQSVQAASDPPPR